MGVDQPQLVDEILFLGRRRAAATAAATLRAVGTDRLALGVAGMRQGHHHVFRRDQVEDVQILFAVADFGAARIAVFLADVDQFLANHLQQHVRVFQDADQPGDGVQQLLVFLGQALLLQAGQAVQAHFQDLRGLHFGQLVAAADQADATGQVFRARGLGAGRVEQRADQARLPGLGQHALARFVRVRRGLDQLDHLVDVGERDGQAFEDVRAGARLAQFEDGAAGDHFAAVADERLQHLLEVHQLRAAVDQRHHVDAEHRLHLGLLVQVVQHHVGGFAALDLDVDAHAVLVGLVAQLADAFELLFLDQLGDLLDQPRLVDLVRDLGDHDRFAAVVLDLDLGLGAHAHAAAAGAIAGDDAGGAVDDAGSREIRAGDVLHQPVDVDLRIVDQRQAGVDRLGQVVRRDVGGHAHRDAGRAVDQQAREARRHHRRFLFLFVVVGLEIDGFLVDVGHHLVREPRHARLGVTHRRRGIAVDRTEVTLPVHHQVTQRERLRHAHQGVVHRLVAVRMVLTDDVADDTRRLVVGLVAVRAQLVHREQHAAMHRLEAVARIREGTPHDHAHGVIEVALAHLVFQVDLDDFLGGFCHSGSVSLVADRPPRRPATGGPAAAARLGRTAVDRTAGFYHDGRPIARFLPARTSTCAPSAASAGRGSAPLELSRRRRRACAPGPGAR
ncbi:hypothetical protein NB705_003554 [Xanthomonas sacchari]|nr:hypothetical protein [Xanthomonas sacchari]